MKICQKKKIKIYFGIFFLLFSLISVANATAQPTQQFSKIFLSPFYLNEMVGGADNNFVLNFNPSDSSTFVSSALITFEVWMNPSINFTLLVDGQLCNNPYYFISSDYASSGKAQVTFDCSNLIQREGTYNLNFKSSKNAGSVLGWADLSYINGVQGNIKVFGTEYQSGDSSKVFAQLFDANGNANNNASCFVTIYYPDNTKYTNHTLMNNLGENGLYYYSLTAPSINGIYMVSVDCFTPSLVALPSTTTIFDNFDLTNSSCGGSGFSSKWIKSGDLLFSSFAEEPNLTSSSNFISVAGSFTTSYQTQTAFLFEGMKGKNLTINLIEMKMNSISGSPQTKDFVYNITMCSTNVSSLSANNSSYGDCVSVPKRVSVNKNFSCSIGDTAYDRLENIYLETPYTTNGNNTILEYDFVNASSVNTTSFWTVQLKGTTGSLNKVRRNFNTSVSQIFPYGGGIDFYYTGAGMTNSSLCFSPPNCLNITKNYITRFFDASNSNLVNISFYSKVEDMHYGDKASVQFFDGTWKTIYEWTKGQEEENWTYHSILLSSGYAFGGNAIRFRMDCVSVPNHALWIDNLTILENKSNYTFQNLTFYQNARGGSELHITNNINNLPSLIWNYTNRNLTFYQDMTNYSNIALFVWNMTNRSLTIYPDVVNYSNIALNVWNYSNRNLTYYQDVVNYLALVTSVWNSTNRNLTYYPDVANYSDIALNVWNYSNRNLTYYQDVVDYLNLVTSVWNYTNRNLTYYQDTTNYTNVAFSVWGWTGSIASNILNAFSTALWSFTNRNLTYYPEIDYNKVSEYVWNYSNRNLTFYQVNNISVSDIWSYMNRSLTLYPNETNYSQVADYVWNYVNRNLTFEQINNISASEIWNYYNRSLTDDIPLQIWNYPNRNVTTDIPFEVWSYFNRTLTYYALNTTELINFISNFTYSEIPYIPLQMTNPTNATINYDLNVILVVPYQSGN